jgi:hypothetical protein
VITLKRLVLFAVFVAALVTLVRHVRNPGPPAKEEKVQLDTWSCPVHKDLKYNRPGKCKVCGEDLVKEEDN